MRFLATRGRSAIVSLSALALLFLAVPALGQSGAASTGAVTEEQFKALHELSKEKAPPLQGKMIEIAKSKAYLSLPKTGKPPFPGIVVIQEFWGLNDHIKHWADRLAAQGYAALAVDLYGGKVATNPDDAVAYMKAVDDKRALEILKAAHNFLATDPRVQAKKRASIGWCFGGGWSLRLAMNAPDLDAAVMYYGQPVTDPAKLSGVKAHLLGIFGNEDQSITPEIVDRFEAALDSAGVEHQILRYDAPHAFANPSNPHYNQSAAADAWKHVQTFLEEHLRPEESEEEGED